MINTFCVNVSEHSIGQSEALEDLDNGRPSIFINKAILDISIPLISRSSQI